MNKINYDGAIPSVFNKSEKDISKIILDTLGYFNVDRKIVEIIFVDEQKIKELNSRYRNIDKPTDVLSFPQTAIAGKEQILGSLVISAGSVLVKKEEIEDVIKHGLLHLLGFDHEENEIEWNDAAKKINCKL